MASAKYLDREDSEGGRPQRPLNPPPDAPDSAVMPDVPMTPGEEQALEKERREDAGTGRIPAGGLPEGIPHGDERPGAKPPPR